MVNYKITNKTNKTILDETHETIAEMPPAVQSTVRVKLNATDVRDIDRDKKSVNII